MYCLYHFSVKCIIKKNYLSPYGPLAGTNDFKNYISLPVPIFYELLKKGNSNYSSSGPGNISWGTTGSNCSVPSNGRVVFKHAV